MLHYVGAVKTSDYVWFIWTLKQIVILSTYSMVQDIILKADSHSAFQKRACFLYETRRLITVFTKARHWSLS
jgi:hypothetical protein